MKDPLYLIISPVRDEQEHIKRTIASVVAQRVRPAQWIVVDDGSRDQTGEILDQAARQHSWIKVIHRPDRGFRKTGSGEIDAFYEAYRTLASGAWDYIVKLDCDLSFEPDYFEKLLARFLADPKLGIASGIYLETREGCVWTEVPMPAYHAAGASKVVRRQCFEEIGGFIPERGWDTVDEIRAVSKGWHTTHFEDLKMKHWKREGTGMGLMHTSIMHGEIYYRVGGGKFFFILKALGRARHRPILFGSAGLVWGYVRSVLRRVPPLVTAEEARAYRSLLYERLEAKKDALLRGLLPLRWNKIAR